MNSRDLAAASAGVYSYGNALIELMSNGGEDLPW